MQITASCRKLQQEEREQYSIEDRAKFLHDTIAAQRKFLAEQRSAAIRNKPPTISQLRNQMITYLKTFLQTRCMTEFKNLNHLRDNKKEEKKDESVHWKKLKRNKEQRKETFRHQGGKAKSKKEKARASGFFTRER
ncbi:hypothetical protein Tco_0336492 [Tanacetum coccineum]